MNCRVLMLLLLVCSLALFADAQLDRIVIPAGTPEDQALQAISNESDPQKKVPMYDDFLQKFASNPAAVAYGNWQLSQAYQGADDMQKALEYGDKALAVAPHNLDILVSQANIAQQAKNRDKLMDYAVRGGEVYNSLEKQPKPADISDQEFASRIADEKNGAKTSYEFLEAAAYNTIAAENDAKKRMTYIEQFTPAFSNSRFGDQVASLAMVSLQELKDMPRLVSYGERSLVENPNSLSTLLLLANAYSEDSKPGSDIKAISYAQKAVATAKADAPDADRSRKLSGGMGHYTIGYVYLKQDKTVAAIPELKSACSLLKGQDDQSYALAAFRLGFAYGKLNKIAEAKEILTEAVSIPGPVQQPAQELLAKVNSARSRVR